MIHDMKPSNLDSWIRRLPCKRCGTRSCVAWWIRSACHVVGLCSFCSTPAPAPGFRLTEPGPEDMPGWPHVRGCLGPLSSADEALVAMVHVL